jgi:hypothetical protein
MFSQQYFLNEEIMFNRFSIRPVAASKEVLSLTTIKKSLRFQPFLIHQRALLPSQCSYIIVLLTVKTVKKLAKLGSCVPGVLG